jgi:hypothetical protein
MQHGRPVAYHTKRLYEARLNYPIYDNELFAHVLEVGNITFGEKNLSFTMTTSRKNI